jgi:hypothetical protein
MRKNLLLTSVLLLSASWAVAQSTTPGASSGSQSSSQSMPSGSSSSQATTPGAGSSGQTTTPGAASGQGAAGVDGHIIEGCLGGTAPNFTVTDKAGTAYKLNIPQGADASQLSKHIGESVQVLGTVSGSGSSSNSSATSSSGTSSTTASGSQPSIDVAKIGRGTGTCAGSSSGASQKPPAQ